MDQIGLFFKCQSCSDYVLTTNIQCPSGHQVCQGCFENLSHCPTCHQRVAPSTRIPFLLTTNVDPILNVGDAFDMLLPSLLRIAPALHPCVADEMIYTGKQQQQQPADSNLNPININNNNNNDTTTTTTTSTTMQQNNCLADQLLMATTSCDVEETLSKLMMLASMSAVDVPSASNASTTSPSSETAPPPGLVATSTPLPNNTNQLGLLNTAEQKQVENFTNF